MRKFIGLIWFPALILCDPSIARAAPTDAEVTYVITNGGVDVKGEGEAHFYAHGRRNGPTID